MTSELYQPFTFGDVVAVPVIVGAVASLFMVTELVLVPLMFVAVQVTVWPAVSVVILVVVQAGDVIDNPLSFTVHVTETSLVYQSLFPSVPVITGVIVGAA